MLFIALIGTPFNLAAQNNTAVPYAVAWNLEQCIDYARQHNIAINQFRLLQKISNEESLLAQSARLPDLSGSLSQTQVYGKSNNGGNKTIHMVADYSLVSSVTLFNGNYLNNNIIQKKLALQSADLAITEQINNVTLQITNAYLAILLDKENIVAAEDVLKTSEAQVTLQQQKFKTGSIARKDLIQTQAQYATDQYALATAQNTERTDLLTLKQLLLLPTTTNFDIIRPDSINTLITATPLIQTEEQALSTRPEIKNAQIGIEIAQYEVKKAKAGYLPALTADAATGSAYGGINSYFEQLNVNFYQQIGLTLVVPLFTRRQIKTHVSEAAINVDVAELNFVNTKITLSQEVERAFINIQNAQSQFNAAQVQYIFNTENYRIGNRQLRIGAISPVDFLVIKTQYLQAQQAYIQAKYNLVLSAKIYDFYRGIPVKL